MLQPSNKIGLTRIIRDWLKDNFPSIQTQPKLMHWSSPVVKYWEIIHDGHFLGYVNRKGVFIYIWKDGLGEFEVLNHADPEFFALLTTRMLEGMYTGANNVQSMR